MDAPGLGTPVSTMNPAEQGHQARRPVPAACFPRLAVPGRGVDTKFGDDQAGNLAALVAYYAFVSIFPLLLSGSVPVLLSAQLPPQRWWSAWGRSATSVLSGFIRGGQSRSRTRSIPVWEVPKDRPSWFPGPGCAAAAIILVVGCGEIAIVRRHRLADPAAGRRLLHRATSSRTASPCTAARSASCWA